jgi:hypothetical protein
MEPRRVCRAVVADFHHFDAVQDSDLDRMKSRIRIRIQVKSWIRLRTKVMRFRNPGSACLHMRKCGHRFGKCLLTAHLAGTVAQDFFYNSFYFINCNIL